MEGYMWGSTRFCAGSEAIYLQQLMDTIVKELATLKCWFDINKLSLHLNKTKNYIIFGNRKTPNQIDFLNHF